MKILILSPRLDCSFKEGYVPDEKGPPNHPIRYHWQRFITNLRLYHEYNNDEVEVLEKALWQFKPEDIDLKNWDICYVPHKNKESFPLKRGKALYYMQTVFPEYFTIDANGWGAGLSFVKEYFNVQNIQKDVPFLAKNEDHLNKWFSAMKSIYTEKSKFDQPSPKIDFPYKDYILFVCQIPHDEVIKLYGFSVLESLRTTLDYCVESGKMLLVKGHPVNLGSMFELQALTNDKKYKNNAKWIDVNENIHDCIKNANAVVTVNSGVGFETILHKKPLIIFGNAEYIKVAKVCYPFSSSMKGIFDRNKFQENIDKYENWLYWFMSHCVNSQHVDSYKYVGKLT